MGWLRGMFGRAKRNAQMADEFRDHLDEKVNELIEAGVSREEAEHAARREFGNVRTIAEDSRAAWGWTAGENLWNDVKYGVRQLRSNPGFTVIAVLTLALGVGANTAIFSMVNAILLKPLPFPEPERLVHIWERSFKSGNVRNVVNPMNFLDWREQSKAFEAMAALTGTTTNLNVHGEPTAVKGGMVSPEFFSILRTRAYLGRTFLREEEKPGQDHSILLGYNIWQREFGSDPNVVGQKIQVDGKPSEIAGVLPKGFSFPGLTAEVFTPMAIERSEEFKGGRYLVVVARLKPGISIEQARQDMLSVASYTQQARPDMDKTWSTSVFPLLDDTTREVSRPLWVLLAAVGFLLLIGCANVANLLLMRGTGRVREMAVRAALGAARYRIIQQLFIESVMIALVGMGVGLFFAHFGLEALLGLVPQNAPLPRGETVAIDRSVLLFAFLASLATAVLFGLVPALRLSRVDLQDALKTGTARSGGVGGHQTLRRAFVVAEVSLALMLSVGAGLVLRSFARLVAVDPGFQREQILTMHVWTSPTRYRDDLKRSQYFERMLTEIRNTPGVQAAGSTHFLPLTDMVSGSCFSDGAGPKPVPAESPSSQFLIVSPGYFKTMGTPLRTGRDFENRDSLKAPPVTVVNQAFADKFYPKQDLVGKTLWVCWDIDKPAEIVGVVANARQTDMAATPEPTIFLSNLQAPMYFASLVVRAQGDPNSIEKGVLAAIHRADPDQAVSSVQTMESVFSDSVSSPRMQTVLLLTFALLAITLAMIGVYGVVSYSVSQRTNEIGIRVALGAGSGDVFGLVLREALLLACVALVVGLLGAFALSRLLESLLFEIKPTDPLTLISVAAVILAVSVVAALVPARKAIRVEPVVALRYE